MKISEQKIELIEFESLEEMPEDEAMLVVRAKAATQNAYSPYSNFCVGAAIHLADGTIIEGSNQENAAYPSGLCAERVAMFYANSKYPDIPVKTIAIAAYSNGDFTNFPVPPCGSCRQVLLETETRYKLPMKIIMFGKDKIVVVNNAKQLLPLNFDQTFLK